MSSAYHVLLDRPALAKFMEVPHYAYLKMKMSGPKGLITVTGDYRKSLECARDGAKLAESLVIAEERRQLDRIIALAGEASAASIPTRTRLTRPPSSPPRRPRK